MATEVIQDASMNRFELLVDGQSAGELDYQIRDNTIVITHTEIDPSKLRAHEVMEIRGSHDRLRAATGWQPEIPLEQTLRDTLESFSCRES